jgi:hypothetical protein
MALVLAGKAMLVDLARVAGMAVVVVGLAVLVSVGLMQPRGLGLHQIYLALELYMQQAGLDQLRVQPVLQTPEMAVQDHLLHLLVVVMAVQAWSSSDTQTHLSRQQAQQVHQQSLCLAGSVFTGGRVQARSRSNHVGLG